MPSRIAGVCGIASQLIGLTALLVAVSAFSWFSWTENYVSVLGVEGSATVLFNCGLILSGVFSLIFAIGLGSNLISSLSSRLGRLGVTSLILGSIALSAMGIFPRSIEWLHNSASIVFLWSIALALILIGVAVIMESHRSWGWLSLSAGVLVVVFQLIPWPWSGGAIQQLLSCLPWSLWTIVFSAVLLTRDGPVGVYQGGVS